MKHTFKSRVGAHVWWEMKAFRPQVEAFENRLQPGNALPLGPLSLMGVSLFDQDPLTGRVDDETPALHRVLPDTHSTTQGLALYVPRVEGAPLQNATPVNTTPVATHIPNDARALQLAAGTVTANQAPHNLAVTTVTQLDAPQAVAATLVPTDLHAQTLDTIFATTSSAVGQQGPEGAAPVWASYFGGPGEDTLRSAALGPPPAPPARPTHRQ